MATSPRAAAGVLLLLACAGAAQAQILGRIACQGRAPTDLVDLQAKGVNGAIEVVWKPVYCAKTYRVTIKRTDVENVNVLAVEVSMPRVVSKNVANGSPYSVTVQACNGELCGPKATLNNVVPAGNVPPTLATFDGSSATAAAAAGVVPPVAPGSTGWQVLTKASTQSKGFRIPHKKPLARRV